MSISLIVSLCVFLLIAVREFLPPFLKIWHIMLAGALVLLALGEIAPRDALHAVDWNIIVYLFAVFSVGRALYDNGFSHEIAARLTRLKHRGTALFVFVMVFAVVAAVMTNDAAAIIGTPIALLLAHRTGSDAKLFLIALCVTVTIGSMATPIGNPQNLLIAASGGVPAPMLTFLAWLIVPTVLCLGLTTLWLLRAANAQSDAPTAEPDFADNTEAAPQGARLWPLYSSLALLVVLVTGESVIALFVPEWTVPLGALAMVAAIPVYVFGQRRVQTLLRIDWPTLVFFVAMFIVTGSLLQSGSIQGLLGGVAAHMNEPAVTAVISFVGSQIVSNVPLVDIYLKLLPSFDVPNLMMLSAISTLAGNVFIISAASNIIVLQAAEHMGGPTIHFSTFAKKVIPIGLISTAIT
ncbi:MAG: SLC13 family permease, partial [Pseudomonadota bacterium]